jgi:hypothetical protein
MADGNIRQVETLQKGELLLGEDGAVVRVTENALVDGHGAPLTTEEAYRITVQGCPPFDVTADHLMTVSWRRSYERACPQPAGSGGGHVYPYVVAGFSDRASLTVKHFAQRYLPPGENAPETTERFGWPTQEEAGVDMGIRGPGRWAKHCELHHAELCQKQAAPKEVEKVKQSTKQFTFKKDAHAGALLPVVHLGTPGQPKDLEALLQVINTQAQKKCTVAPGELLEIAVNDLAKRKGELWARVVKNEADAFQQFSHRIMARMSPVLHPLDASAIPSVWTTETTLSAFASATAATVDLGEGDVCYQFNQRVGYSAASAAYKYTPLAADDPRAIFVVLHQPLVKESRLDPKGEVAFTIKQLEKAWDLLGLYGRGCVISETMSLCAKIGEVKADDPKFAKVTEQVMRTQIGSGVRTFVVCGGLAKRLWSKAHKIMPDLHLQFVGLQHHQVDGKANAPYLLFRVPKSSGQ